MLQVTRQTCYTCALHRPHQMDSDRPFFNDKFDMLRLGTEKLKDSSDVVRCIPDHDNTLLSVCVRGQ